MTDEWESAIEKAVSLFQHAHTKCMHCSKTRYEHRDHFHRPGVCTFGDCDKFTEEPERSNL